MMKTARVTTALQGAADLWRSEAKTVIWFSQENEMVAVIAIADRIKASSAAAVAALEKMGVEVYMLTGDNKETARAVAQQAGLKNFHAESLPSAKAAFAKQLQQQGKVAQQPAPCLVTIGCDHRRCGGSGRHRAPPCFSSDSVH